MSEIRVDTISEKTSGSGTTVSNLKNPNQPFRNLIINGDMSIAQRGTSFASVGNTDSQYTLDRWKFTEEGDFGAAEITITQDTDVPTGEGFAKSLKCVCATVDTSIDSGTIAYIEQRIEGQNLQHIAKGTSGAKKMTYSFFCKSNLTGTFTIAFFDQDNTRSFTTSYSLASANTWERIVINIPADTTGAFTNDNNTSFIIQMNLQAGTSKSNGALATAFEATSQGDRAVGQTNFFSSTDNNWYITGCQLEVGETATDFEHLPHDVQLQRCQRYCAVLGGTHETTATFGTIGVGYVTASTQAFITYQHIVPMRGLPSETTSADSHFCLADSVGSVVACTGIAINQAGSDRTLFLATTAGSLTAARPTTLLANNNASATLTLDAEL